MRWVVWMVRLLLFAIILAFAMKNTTPVRIQLFFNWYLELPMVLVLLIVFVVGAIVGLTAAMGSIWRHSREAARLKRQLRQQNAEQAYTPMDQVKTDKMER